MNVNDGCYCRRELSYDASVAALCIQIYRNIYKQTIWIQNTAAPSFKAGLDRVSFAGEKYDGV